MGNSRGESVPFWEIIPCKMQAWDRQAASKFNRAGRGRAGPRVEAMPTSTVILSLRPNEPPPIVETIRLKRKIENFIYQLAGICGIGHTGHFIVIFCYFSHIVFMGFPCLSLPLAGILRTTGEAIPARCQTAGNACRLPPGAKSKKQYYGQFYYGTCQNLSWRINNNPSRGFGKVWKRAN